MNTQFDHDDKNGSNIYSKHMSAQDYMQTYKHSLLNLLPRPPPNRKGNKRGDLQGVNDIKVRSEVSYV